MAGYVGQKIPDITVQALGPDDQIQELRPSDYQGKWLVLFFYPLDFTFV